MVCLRGPCQHHWSLTMRFDGADPGERVFTERYRTCIRHSEEMDLREQNVYACEQWWPLWLAFVPETARGVFRTALCDVWEWWLKHRGYDFSWRWFTPGAFEADDTESRKFSGPGGNEAAAHARRVSADKPSFGA